MKRLLLILLLVPAALPAADFDLLVKGARVVDGTGNPWYRADVGVLDGKIAAIGSLGQLSATRVVEARELVLAPGFIDVHTHVEDEVENFPDADNFLRDGVTSIVTGNCGGSKTDLAAFFSRLEELGLGPNVASLIGHNSVRRKVMGSENRPAEAQEIAKMQELVDTAMRDGAVGLSTGLIYVPGTYAGTDEVTAGSSWKTTRSRASGRARSSGISVSSDRAAPFPSFLRGA